MIGIGIINGTKATNTPTTSSSARMLPKSRNESDNGFVKLKRLSLSSNIY